ncbi:MAG: M48 family metalloprotease [Burkholderiales bacterium]
MKVATVILGLFVLSACAPATKRIAVDETAIEIEAQKQAEIALQALLKDQQRLSNLAYGLRIKAISQCGDEVGYTLGGLFVNSESFSEELRRAAASLFRVNEFVSVLGIVPGSVADVSGLKVGDTLLAINDWPAPIGKEAPKLINEKIDELGKKAGSVRVKFKRGDTEHVVDVAPAKACSYRIALSGDDAINAFADGRNVIVTRGMMRFAENDTELGLVVSHEMAHNAMGHIRAKTTNYMLGTLLDVLIAVGTGVDTQNTFGRIGAQVYSQDFEAEADYVGLYMMAHAGMNIESAPQFWRRMAAVHPASIKSGGLLATHPATPYRMLALEKTVEEINNKKATGLPLTPELKTHRETAHAAVAKVSEPQQPEAIPATQAASVASAITQQTVATSQTLGVRLTGKEPKQTLALISGLTLEFTLDNRGTRGITRAQGTAIVTDPAGDVLGRIRLNVAWMIKAGESVKVVETLYRALFPGDFDKLKATDLADLKVRFEPESIEFAEAK